MYNNLGSMVDAINSLSKKIDLIDTIVHHNEFTQASSISQKTTYETMVENLQSRVATLESRMLKNTSDQNILQKQFENVIMLKVESQINRVIKDQIEVVKMIIVNNRQEIDSELDGIVDKLELFKKMSSENVIQLCIPSQVQTPQPPQIPSIVNDGDPQPQPQPESNPNPVIPSITSSEKVDNMQHGLTSNGNNKLKTLKTSKMKKTIDF